MNEFDEFYICKKCNRFSMFLEDHQHDREYLHVKEHSNTKPGPGNQRVLLWYKLKNKKITFF